MILERVKRCKSIDKLVLAIPKTKENKILKKIANDLEVKCFEGSENNLIERFYFAAKEEKADIVGRLPADNAVPEPEEIDKIANFHRSRKDVGFSTNLESIFSSGYPNGIGAEMFDFSLLEEVYIKKNFDILQKEHVHLNFFNYETEVSVNKKWCNVRTIKCPKEYARPELVLDVNNVEDGEFIKFLYETLYERKPNFTITDIISLLDKK